MDAPVPYGEGVEYGIDTGKGRVLFLDKRINRALFPSSIGVGISQVVPVIVNTYDHEEYDADLGVPEDPTGRSYPERNKTCRVISGIRMIEQPELHLHPAMQAKLGDMFIHSLNAFDTPVEKSLFIETHSEHILLRVLRRIRETTAGLDPKLPASEAYPDGLSLKIRPEDVSVVYVKATEEGTKVYPLEITPDGDFATDWPDGFFTEREEDLFS